MKAAYIQRTGPPENIRVGELEAPRAADSHVLVRVEAVDVNPIDTYVRSGAVAMPLPIPYIVGCDLAGVVEAVGPKATRFRVGDRVWGSNQGLLGRQGTTAELAAVDEMWLYPTPEGVSSETAVAVSLVGITAHLGLVREARLQSGEVLFVNGGSGGVGSMVVQMARAIGARVVTTAGSAEKLRCATSSAPIWRSTTKAKTWRRGSKSLRPQGINVWWETLREPDFDRAVGNLAPRGRMVVMAGREARPPFPVGPFYVKGCSLHGFAMFNATADQQRAAADDINRWLTSGQLKPNIDRVLPIEETAAAHRLQEDNTLHKAGTLTGKIIIKTQGS